MSEQEHFSRRLREMADDFERAIGEGRAGQIAARAIARAQTSPRRRMLAVVAATTVSLALALVGVAALSDSSVPGDFLYDVDRAVEILGFDSNGLEERLEEVIVLADRGQAESAVLLAAEALAEIERTHQIIPISPSPTTTVAATPSPGGGIAPMETQDPVLTLRLAAEFLLRTIRDPEAADDLADAVAALAAAALALDEAEEEPTSTTTAPSTTIPAEEEPTSTTTAPSTTIPGEDGSTTSTTEAPDPGPIIFPPMA